ncbi:adenosylmethionine decarboxylase [Massilia sp. W12]|uniref:adenosylmethionine decarboxylase n=1 Tax=Massilia sp. W12 TaxID=3126507 RepID=UPI0030CE758C
MSSAHHASGQHLLADLHGVAPSVLQDGAALEALMREAAQRAGAHILFSHLHSFGPQAGVTGVLLLAESHISIHTWPESGFAALDIFMCGAAQPGLALDFLCQALQAQQVQTRTVARGDGSAV